MKKDYQRIINEKAVLLYAQAIDEYNDQCRFDDCYRLDYCQAWVYETRRFFILRSYNTIVACIEKETDTLVDMLRGVYGYTPTSAKHISKFAKSPCFGSYGKGKWGCENSLRYYPVD